ncbi:MAG: redoxin domain-containing protein [Limisphaerales bacterium]
MMSKSIISRIRQSLLQTQTLFALALLAAATTAICESENPTAGIGAPNAQQTNLPPLPEAPVRLDAFALADPAGAIRNLSEFAGKSATVVVLLYDTCPMSQRAAPILEQLRKDESANGAQVLGVFIDGTTKDEMEKFRDEFGLTFPLVVDTGGKLAAALGAHVVPEAFVLDRDGKVRYCGRIDDSYQVRGVKTLAPPRQDLAEALNDVLEGSEVRLPRTLAVGCAISMVGNPEPAPEAPTKEITYHKDVAPILRTHCMSCHSPGNPGPFPLLTYDDAADMMRVGLQEILARRMPPGQVDSDLEMIRAYTLKPEEIETIKAWIKAGRPEGDPTTATPLEPLPNFGDFEQELGPPDIILEQDEPFHLGPVGNDVYRNLVFQINSDKDLRLRAIQMIPSDRSIVHHALIGYAPHHSLQEALQEHSGPSPTYTTGDSGPGFYDEHSLGFRLPGPRSDGMPLTSFVSGYVPGSGTCSLPEDTDCIIPAGSDLIVQMHYHRNGKQSQDSTRIGLWLRKDDKISRKMSSMQFLHGELVVIPAGIKDMKVSGQWNVAVECSMVGVTPHAHMLARSVEISADIPGRGNVLIARVPRWDYDWQQPYWLKTPLPLPVGSVVKCSATFDNSSENPRNPNNPPQPMFLGEATTDEMLLPLVVLSADRVTDTGDGGGFMPFFASMVRSTLLRNYYYDRLPFEVLPDGTVVRVGYTENEVFKRLPKPVDPTVPESEYKKH